MRPLSIARLLGTLWAAMLLLPSLPLVAGQPSIVGGEVTGEVTGTGDVRWILPGLRRLDPGVFGTPDSPLGFEADVGLPLGARLTNADGTAYTTTAMPTPFSDSWSPVSGDYQLVARDATFTDDPNSQDSVSFTATFASPAGDSYEVTVNQIIPVGPDHTFFGGVGINIVHHGTTGIGTKLMPTVFTYVAFWGVGTLSVNGEPVATNRLVHSMVTESVRDADYLVVFDDGVDPTRTHSHLILPPTEITPDGPSASPVPTGFVLPNGMEQPFLHIMYEEIQITGLNLQTELRSAEQLLTLSIAIGTAAAVAVGILGYVAGRRGRRD